MLMSEREPGYTALLSGLLNALTLALTSEWL